MKAFLLPLIMIGAGVGAGIGAALLLGAAPEPPSANGDEAAVECIPVDQIDPARLPPPPAEATEFVKFHNQFMVPVMRSDNVESLVVMSVSVEVAEGNTDAILAREPKLRDAFLQVMFDHATAGGFDGNFLGGSGLDALRKALREVAVAEVGDSVTDVLIVDLVKQKV